MKTGRRRKIEKKHFYFSRIFIIFIFIILLSIILINKNNKIFSNLLENDSKAGNCNTTETANTTIEVSSAYGANSSTDSEITASSDYKILTTTEFSIDAEIENIIDDFRIENNLNEDNFAFFYYNIDTNKQYLFNEYTYFTAASTVKLPIAMLYYDKINDGSISASDTLLYKSSCYEAGNGTTNYYYSAGDYVPINFLLKQSIVNSDNTAINILMDNLGSTVECRKQINKYTDETVSEDFYNSNLTYAKYSFDILNYLYSNMDNYEELIENLKISSNGEYLKKYISDYDVAHKYGSYNGYVHDYGIVFGKSTYLIGVFTKNISNASELISDISLEILNYTLD